jgi:hypothetical protein
LIYYPVPTVFILALVETPRQCVSMGGCTGNECNFAKQQKLFYHVIVTFRRNPLFMLVDKIAAISYIRRTRAMIEESGAYSREVVPPPSGKCE